MSRKLVFRTPSKQPFSTPFAPRFPHFPLLVPEPPLSPIPFHKSPRMSHNPSCLRCAIYQGVGVEATRVHSVLHVATRNFEHTIDQSRNHLGTARSVFPQPCIIIPGMLLCVLHTRLARA